MRKLNPTKGPWHVGMKPGPIIYGPKGEQIADMQGLFCLEADEYKANIALVTSAPDLYAALVDVEHELDNWHNWQLHCNPQYPGSKGAKTTLAALIKARDAIDKAENL